MKSGDQDAVIRRIKKYQTFNHYSRKVSTNRVYLRKLGLKSLKLCNPTTGVCLVETIAGMDGSQFSRVSKYLMLMSCIFTTILAFILIVP